MFSYTMLSDHVYVHAYVYISYHGLSVIVPATTGVKYKGMGVWVDRGEGNNTWLMVHCTEGKVSLAA